MNLKRYNVFKTLINIYKYRIFISFFFTYFNLLYKQFVFVNYIPRSTIQNKSNIFKKFILI